MLRENIKIYAGEETVSCFGSNTWGGFRSTSDSRATAILEQSSTPLLYRQGLKVDLAYIWFQDMNVHLPRRTLQKNIKCIWAVCISSNYVHHWSKLRPELLGMNSLVCLTYIESQAVNDRTVEAVSSRK
jgi:hypothetical protein